MKYIFQIKIKPGQTEQDYIEAWEKGSEIIQKSKGAQGTILYRKIDEPGTLIAIASWESKQARDDAMAKLETVDLNTRKILDKHMEYADKNILGHFEEITRVEPELE